MQHLCTNGVCSFPGPTAAGRRVSSALLTMGARRSSLACCSPEQVPELAPVFAGVDSCTMPHVGGMHAASATLWQVMSRLWC